MDKPWAGHACSGLREQSVIKIEWGRGKMIDPILINRDQTISESGLSFIIQGCRVHNVAFIHGGDDVIDISARNVNVLLQQTVGATVTDHTIGMHVGLDPFSPLTTFVNMQQDPYAHIDLFRSPFADTTDLASHLQVVPQGTILTAAIHGPPVAYFVGDYNVRPEQFSIHH